MPIRTSVFGGNLGDTLWVTPLARYDPDVTVWMRGDDVKALSVAPILNNICCVELKPNPPETAKYPIRAHVTQQILAAYGHGGKPSIPNVILTNEEIEWAINWAKENCANHSKTLAIVNHCSGSADPTNYRAAYVRGNPNIFKAIISFWKGAGYRIFQFGPPEGFYKPDVFNPIEGTIPVRGLTIRQLAAVYHVIGKMISLDTGDYHLMLAVGGKVGCLIPPHSDLYGYRHWDLCYDSVCWGQERPRVIYAVHDQWMTFLNTNLFNYMS